MPLIPCPSCGNQISQMAVACPKCGHPMSASPTHSYPPNYQHISPPIQTIEQTSKGFKLGQVIGVLIIVAGMAACGSTNPSAAPVIMGAGVVVYIASRLGAWWSNG